MGVSPGGVASDAIHPGDEKPSIGGRNQASGRNGVILADWNDGNTAISAKVLNNGKRTIHIGVFWFGGPSGANGAKLVRNAIGWAAGGIPSPRIAAFSHTYGDNGIYTVDLMMVDDDMGFVWDAATKSPRAVLPNVVMSHRLVPVSVDNVDPTIMPGTIQAFIATQVCLRVEGTAGNTVKARVFTDGTLSTEISVTRVPEPDDDDDDDATVRCGMLKIDVMAQHTFSATLTYASPSGGANPTQLDFSPFRDPEDDEVVFKFLFQAGGPTTVNQPLTTLKRELLLDEAPIDFEALAVDPGTDDLAFLWVFGGDEFELELDDEDDLEEMAFAIHVMHNDGRARTDGTLNPPQLLGFSEPFFNRPANTGRSSFGTMNFMVRDTVFHEFDLDDHDSGTTISPLFFYVVLIVLDDDNTRGFPSTFANDGIDIEFVFLDFR